MDEKLKNVREEIEKTRVSLVENVELLDARVREPVDETRHGVSAALRDSGESFE